MNEILTWMPVVVLIFAIVWYFWCMFTETKWWRNISNKKDE